MTNNFGKHIFVILLLSCFSYQALAQGDRMRMHGGFRRGPNFVRQNQYYHPNQYYRPNTQVIVMQPGIRRLQTIKENFVHNQLSLTTEQSVKFLPVYRQYQQELINVYRLKRLNNTDAQANGAEQIHKNLAYEKQILDIKAHYTDEFLKIMPAEKVSLITKSEREFNDEIIRQPAERVGPPPPSN
jgi:hypothetical protein